MEDLEQNKTVDVREDGFDDGAPPPSTSAEDVELRDHTGKQSQPNIGPLYQSSSWSVAARASLPSGDTSIDFDGEQDEDKRRILASVKLTEKTPLIAGEAHAVGDDDQVLVPVDSLYANRAEKFYRQVVHFIAKDLQDHNEDFPFRLSKTEWPRFKNYVAGNAFVAHKIWAPTFWLMFMWDLFPGLALSNSLYGITFAQILGGIADNPITITSNFGSDVPGEALYYLPILLIGLSLATGGGIWASDFFRDKLEPQLKAFEKSIPGIYQDYVKWKAGNLKPSLKDIPFWVIVLATLYADARLIELVILKFIGFVKFLNSKVECENQNKVWAYLNDWGNFECVVTNAGYLPDYRKFTSQLALDGLLSISRDPAFILENIDELLEHPFGRFDLSRQEWRNWPRPQLKALLSKVSAKVKSLDVGNFSSSVPYSSFPNDGRLDDVTEFARNVMLRVFSVINQGIGQTGFEQIWNATAPNLHEIEVGGNNIQAIPAPLNTTQITRFSAPRTLLGDAGVVDLAQGLQNSQVSEIELSDVGMMGPGIAAASEILPNTNVKKIDVSDNNFQDVDLTPVGESLASSNVESADFSGTQLVDDQVNGLTASLQGAKIKSLKFRNNGLTNIGMFSVVRNCQNSSVTAVDFYGNAIDDDGVTSSLGFLPGTSLNHLGLGNTQISAESVGWLSQSGKIQSVDASSNQIGPDVVNLLLQNKGFLEHLDLTMTGLDTASAVKLVGVLPGSTFKSLILAGNNLQDPFLIAFAKALPEIGLVVLDVNLNQLTDASVTAVAKMLPQSVLERFVLGNNLGVTDAGGVALAQSLIEPTAEANTIGNPQVSRYEARYLRQAKLIVRLRELNLDGNNVGESTVRAAEQVLSGRDFTFRTNSSSQFYSNPSVQPRLVGNANGNANAATGAVGLLAIVPRVGLFFLALYLLYRMSKCVYNVINSEGTPSCKK